MQAEIISVRPAEGRKRFGDPEHWKELIVLTRTEMAAQIASGRGYSYVYVLFDRERVPFYIGKGKGPRVFQHEAEALNPTRKSHKLNLIRRIQRDGYEIGYALAGFFEEEADALKRERDLIALYGRHDLGLGPLTNQVDGGEGPSNPSTDVQKKHAASLGGDAEDPERKVANRFLAGVAGQQDSVPIKPWRVLCRSAHLLRPSPNKPVPQPTVRMAKAIAAAALAQGVLLEEGAVFQRCFMIEGVECAIENGCGGDMIAAGLVVPMEPREKPADERLQLTARGERSVDTLVGHDKLVDLGLVEP